MTVSSLMIIIHIRAHCDHSDPYSNLVCFVRFHTASATLLQRGQIGVAPLHALVFGLARDTIPLKEAWPVFFPGGSIMFLKMYPDLTITLPRSRCGISSIDPSYKPFHYDMQGCVSRIAAWHY